MVEKLLSHFLVCTLIASIVIALILIAKHLLKRGIAARWQYRIDKLLLLSLIIPLIPVSLYGFFGVDAWFKEGVVAGATSNATTNTITQEGNVLADGSTWLQDFSLSVDRFVFNEVLFGLGIIWLIGAVVVALMTFVCNRDLRLIKESVVPITDEAMSALFEGVKSELNIKKRVRFVSSILVKSPITVGLLKTYVILPYDLNKKLSLSGLRYVLLHELTHCKNGDIHINAIMCLFQIVYWFNPLVYLAFRITRIDRELSCDQSVLDRLERKDHLDYGKTLLNFTNNTQFSKTFLVANMGGTKKQIKSRIEAIASSVHETRLVKAKSSAILCFFSALVFCQIPMVAAFASDDESTYQLEGENVIYEDMATYFEGFEGSFVLYDLGADKYSIYNKEKNENRVSPASTYKIYSALIAMETETISASSSIKEWNGTIYPYESWNRAQDLESAMKNSVSWYFQGLDEQVGIDTLESYYAQLGYGNYNLSGGIEDYWMESSLQVSPIEQVKLLKDVYEYDTFFEAENVDALKNILVLSTKEGLTLSGKTGTGTVNNHVVNGWFVGCVESEVNSYFFAVNIQGDDDASGSAATQIALAILADNNIY